MRSVVKHPSPLEIYDFLLREVVISYFPFDACLNIEYSMGYIVEKIFENEI